MFYKQAKAKRVKRHKANFTRNVKKKKKNSLSGRGHKLKHENYERKKKISLVKAMYSKVTKSTTFEANERFKDKIIT